MEDGERRVREESCMASEAGLTKLSGRGPGLDIVMPSLHYPIHTCQEVPSLHYPIHTCQEGELYFIRGRPDKTVREGTGA